jgi:hypothetical protein
MTSLNSLQQVEFMISVKRLPNVSFRAQRVVIPSITSNAAEQPSPLKKLYHTPDTLTYGDFSITFALDEEFQTWFEISKWMEGIAFPGKFSEYKNIRDSDFGLKSDITVNIMTSKKNTNFNMTAYDCFPTMLSEINLDSTQSEAIAPELTVNFAYNGFKMEKAT